MSFLLSFVTLLALQVSDPKTVVTGHVVDEMGAPVAGAYLHIDLSEDWRWPKYESALSLTDGSFSITCPGGSAYQLEASCPGYGDRGYTSNNMVRAPCRKRPRDRCATRRH